MDSDDISRQDRIKSQLDYFSSNESFSLVGGYIKEFDICSSFNQKRVVPSRHKI